MTSLLLLLKFGYDLVKRLIDDAHFRALGAALLMVLAAGTLFFWLVEGRPFLHALAFSAGTMAMNSPYGISWGPATTAGVIFHIIFPFFGVGLFLLFVIEAGKTMSQSCEQGIEQIAERKAKKQERKAAAKASAER